MNEPRSAEDVVIEAQKIAALLHLGTYLKASQLGTAKDTGTQVILSIPDQQRTQLWINSKLIEEVLTAEFNKLGQELSDSGVELDALMKGEHQRFSATYLAG